jgi:hypothetical protein
MRGSLDFHIESLRALNLSARASTEFNWMHHGSPVSSIALYRPAAHPSTLLVQPAAAPATSAPAPASNGPVAGRFRSCADRRQHSFRDASAPVPLTSAPVPNATAVNPACDSTGSDTRQQWFQHTTAPVPAPTAVVPIHDGSGSDGRQQPFRHTTAAVPVCDSTASGKARTFPTCSNLGPCAWHGQRRKARAVYFKCRPAHSPPPNRSLNTGAMRKQLLMP